MEKSSFNDDADYDLVMLRNIEGLRLQPLVDLESGKTVAWEVLAKTTCKQPEKFFSTLSSVHYLTVFTWQVEETLNCTGKFWFNLPAQIFKDPFYVSKIIKLKHDNRLTLEIQDPTALLSMNTLELTLFKEGIQRLRDAGWPVWLDDLTDKLAPYIGTLNLPLDGIKIDRKEINNPGSLAALVTTARSWVPEVVIEGIETPDMLRLTGQTDAQYGQGFYWPEMTAILPIPTPYIAQGKRWRREKQLSELAQITITITCHNNYYKQGLYALLWPLLRDSYETGSITPFRLVEGERDADIILRECIPGQKPVDCQISASHSEHQNRPLRRKYYIAINNYNEDISLSRCPGLDGIISPFDSTAKIISLIKNILSQAMSRKIQGCRQEFTSACRLCIRNVLTEREKDIVKHMRNGEPVSLIASRYGCTEKNISNHKRSIMRKLNLKTNISFYRYLNQASMEKEKQNNGI